MQRMENTVIAFNFMWIQFLKFCASVMLMASIYFAYKEFKTNQLQHTPIIAFHLSSPFGYILAIRWLDCLDHSYSQQQDVKSFHVTLYGDDPYKFQVGFFFCFLWLQFN